MRAHILADSCPTRQCNCSGVSQNAKDPLRGLLYRKEMPEKGLLCCVR